MSDNEKEQDGRAEFELKSPPTDGITHIEFAERSSKVLLVSSWDFSVGLYNVEKNSRLLHYRHECPVLSCCFLGDERYCASAGSDGHIIIKNIQANQRDPLSVIGNHRMAVKSLKYNKNHNLILSGSWDTTVNAYDPRINNLDETTRVSQLSHNGKIFSMDLLGDNKLIVATSLQEIFIWDLRNMKKPSQQRKSTLQNQIRAVSGFPNGEGFVTASAEGRASVDFVQKESGELTSKYTFKCHREKHADKTETVHPVNCLAFHEKYKTFVTGGSDGYINIWDPYAKKRIYQLNRYPVGVVDVAFSNDSKNLLAVACSYNYELEEDPVEVPTDRIYIKRLSDHEIKPTR